MTEHMCQGSWTPGSVASCTLHQQTKSAPDVRPLDDRRTRLRIDGVAKTGQISPKGTVEHLDYYSGRVAATAKPSPIYVKLMEMPWFRDHYEYRDGKLIEKATGKEVAWTQKRNPLSNAGSSPKSNRTSSTTNSTAPTLPKSAPDSRRLGVSIGRNGAPLQRTASSPPP